MERRTLLEITSDMQNLAKFSNSCVSLDTHEIKTMLEMVMLDVQFLAEHLREHRSHERKAP